MSGQSTPDYRGKCKAPSTDLSAGRKTGHEQVTRPCVSVTDNKPVGPVPTCLHNEDSNHKEGQADQEWEGNAG